MLSRRFVFGAGMTKLAIVMGISTESPLFHLLTDLGLVINLMSTLKRYSSGLTKVIMTRGSALPWSVI